MGGFSLTSNDAETREAATNLVVAILGVIAIVAATIKADDSQQHSANDALADALAAEAGALPVGERLKYVLSDLAYTLTYRTPQARSRVAMDWFGGQVFVWLPDLKRWAEIVASLLAPGGFLYVLEGHPAAMMPMCRPDSQAVWRSSHCRCL